MPLGLVEPAFPFKIVTRLPIPCYSEISHFSFCLIVVLWFRLSRDRLPFSLMLVCIYALKNNRKVLKFSALFLPIAYTLVGTSYLSPCLPITSLFLRVRDTMLLLPFSWGPVFFPRESVMPVRFVLAIPGCHLMVLQWVRTSLAACQIGQLSLAGSVGVANGSPKIDF